MLRAGTGDTSLGQGCGARPKHSGDKCESGEVRGIAFALLRCSAERRRRVAQCSPGGVLRAAKGHEQCRIEVT